MVTRANQEVKRFFHIAILHHSGCLWETSAGIIEPRPFGKEDNLVVMDNGLARASWNLTLNEHKLARLLISKIDQNDIGYRTYQVHPREFSTQHLSIDKIRDLCMGLMEKPILIEKRNPKPKEKAFIIVHLLTVLGYDSAEGFIKFKFNPSVRSYLVALVENFITYDPAALLDYKSKYSIQLEEILRSYKGMKYVTLPLARLKKMLSVGSKYRVFRDFKSRVLEPAKLELKSTFPFRYKAIRTGKTVCKVRFAIQ